MAISIRSLDGKRVPLERALSKLGLASRTMARGLIQAGRVRVNGDVRKHPLYPVNPARARIEVDGVAVRQSVFRSFLLHKPRGVVTTRADEKGRSTVFSLVPGDPGAQLHAVGRLDLATSGLLVLTNDTGLSSWLTDPENHVSRVYLVSVRGQVTPERLRDIEGGIRMEGELLQAQSIALRKASRRESHLVIELRQGKNREIRRLMEAFGHEVTRLKRVSFGGLGLGTLAPGEHRELTAEEIEASFPGIAMREN